MASSIIDSKQLRLWYANDIRLVSPWLNKCNALSAKVRRHVFVLLSSWFMFLFTSSSISPLQNLGLRINTKVSSVKTIWDYAWHVYPHHVRQRGIFKPEFGDRDVSIWSSRKSIHIKEQDYLSRQGRCWSSPSSPVLRGHITKYWHLGVLNRASVAQPEHPNRIVPSSVNELVKA